MSAKFVAPAVALTLAVVAAAPVIAAPAAAAPVSPTAAAPAARGTTPPGNAYYLSSTFGGEADTVFQLGGHYDEVYVGDWDGDGKDTLAYRRGATFYVRNSNTPGAADVVFTYGRADDVVLVGDWDGDGTDTFAVRRGAQYHVKNSVTSGPADVVAVYGRPDDTVLVGDWDGDRKDTLAVRRGADYFIKNVIATGVADGTARYGRAQDDVYVGDWDGNDTDTFTVRRGSVYYLANAIREGNADRVVPYGLAADITLVGDWDGDGVDTLGIRRYSATPVTTVLPPSEQPPVAGTPSTTPQPDQAVKSYYEGIASSYQAPTGSRYGTEALAWAQTQLGIPYIYGGTGAADGGYDCSGLTMRAFEAAGVKLPRVSRDQWGATARVALADLQPGDLVFWSNNGLPSGIYHVAIYAGDNKRLQAAQPGRNVEIAAMWNVNLLPYGGRVL